MLRRWAYGQSSPCGFTRRQSCDTLRNAFRSLETLAGTKRCLYVRILPCNGDVCSAFIARDEVNLNPLALSATNATVTIQPESVSKGKYLLMYNGGHLIPLSVGQNTSLEFLSLHFRPYDIFTVPEVSNFNLDVTGTRTTLSITNCTFAGVLSNPTLDFRLTGAETLLSITNSSVQTDYRKHTAPSGIETRIFTSGSTAIRGCKWGSVRIEISLHPDYDDDLLKLRVANIDVNDSDFHNCDSSEAILSVVNEFPQRPAMVSVHNARFRQEVSSQAVTYFHDIAVVVLRRCRFERVVCNRTDGGVLQGVRRLLESAIHVYGFHNMTILLDRKSELRRGALKVLECASPGPVQPSIQLEGVRIPPDEIPSSELVFISDSSFDDFLRQQFIVQITSIKAVFATPVNIGRSVTPTFPL